jgi:hypothetical protein
MEGVQKTQELVLASVLGIPPWMRCHRLSPDRRVSHAGHGSLCRNLLGGSVALCQTAVANVALPALGKRFFSGFVGNYFAGQCGHCGLRKFEN